MKLKQLALITSPEIRLLVIQPFDAGTVQDIQKAILESKVGITPAIDGKLIRLRIPELSEERRKDLVRTVNKLAEEARVRIRACRREAMDGAKKLEKEGKITEDDLERAEKEIQKITDKSVADIDKHVVHKDAELMKV
jgi:ribosome recycling factor